MFVSNVSYLSNKILHENFDIFRKVKMNYAFIEIHSFKAIAIFSYDEKLRDRICDKLNLFYGIENGSGSGRFWILFHSLIEVLRILQCVGINLGLIVAVWLCSKIIGFIGSLFSKDMNNSDIGWYAEHISVSLNHYYCYFQQLFRFFCSSRST